MKQEISYPIDTQSSKFKIALLQACGWQHLSLGEPGIYSEFGRYVGKMHVKMHLDLAYSVQTDPKMEFLYNTLRSQER